MFLVDTNVFLEILLKQDKKFDDAYQYSMAKYCGLKVVTMDILERMIDRANERARREDVEDRVSFRVADAQDLPFEDNIFDVVIGEFITGLLDDIPVYPQELARILRIRNIRWQEIILLTVI